MWTMKKNADGTITLTPDEASLLGLAALALGTGESIRSFNHSIAFQRAACMLLDPDGTTNDARELAGYQGPDVRVIDDLFTDAARGLTPGIM